MDSIHRSSVDEHNTGSDTLAALQPQNTEPGASSISLNEGLGSQPTDGQLTDFSAEDMLQFALPQALPFNVGGLFAEYSNELGTGDQATKASSLPGAPAIHHPSPSPFQQEIDGLLSFPGLQSIETQASTQHTPIISVATPSGPASLTDQPSAQLIQQMMQTFPMQLPLLPGIQLPFPSGLLPQQGFQLQPQQLALLQQLMPNGVPPVAMNHVTHQAPIMGFPAPLSPPPSTRPQLQEILPATEEHSRKRAQALAAISKVPQPPPPVSESADGSKERRAYNHESFPCRLHRVVTECMANGKSHIVSFNEQGDAFRIWNPGAFSSTICPLYFRHSRWKSFQRQVSKRSDNFDIVLNPCN